MSGIVALFHFDKKPIDEPLVRKMVASQKRRGPDGSAYWAEGAIALGHAKLQATLESVHENQPSHLDNQFWLTADARIDARAELIEKIAQAGGARLSLHVSDDQLILWAYKIWAEDCLQYLIGDFAFVLWDRGNNRLFCATDQFGVTPLYYAEVPGGICLSNSINAIRCHPDVSTELDPLAIADYLLFRANTNANGTSFEKINHVPASHSLCVDKGRIRLRNYWQFKPRSDIRVRSSAEYIEEFRHLMELAVSDRIRTDSIATHLSGGMDSTSVAAIAHQFVNSSGSSCRLKAYTRGSGGSTPGAEVPYAKQVVEQLNIPHQIYGKDEPDLEMDEIPSELFSPEPSFMRRNITRFHMLNDINASGSVVLSGYGGDALFSAPYVKFQDFSSPSKLISRTREFWMHYQTFGRRPAYGFKRAFTARKESTKLQAPGWLNDYFVQKYGLNERYSDLIAIRSDLGAHQERMVSEPLWRRIFCWMDPGVTHIPVKVYHPFFDVRLLNYVKSLPPFPWLQNKHVLRQCMVGDLPEAIISRPKTILPSNPLGKTLELQGIPPHFYELIQRPEIADFINVQQFKDQFQEIGDYNEVSLSSMIRAVTLSNWMHENETAFKSFYEGLEDDNIERISL